MTTVTTVAMPLITKDRPSVQAGLESAIQRYVASNPRSAEVYAAASQHLPAGNTRTTIFTDPFPLAIKSASGSQITSVDDRAYTDLLGEYTAGIYGHSHPSIVAAVTEGLRHGINFGATSPFEAELAALIKQRFACAGLELVRFTNSGTEANLMAVTTARAFTGRSTILVFNNGYHGAVQSWRNPSASAPTNIPGDYIMAPYNDRSALESILASIPPDSLAGVLVEPMQGAGGSFPASPDFLRFLRAKTGKLGALLIFDEVMTSRLHYSGGLSGKYGIRPDLITMGKYLGGGMSFGLFGGRRDVLSLYNPKCGGHVSADNHKYGPNAPKTLAHSGTFNNNIVTMCAGIAGAKLLNQQVLDAINDLGDSLRQSLSTLFASRGITQPPSLAGLTDPDINHVSRGAIWISGIGSIMTVHFGVNDELHYLRDLYWFYLLENGFYIARRGFITLAMTSTKKEIDSFVKVTENFLDEWSHAIQA
ncbi:hypothetical protein LTR47_009567 [Exophiala xenobiotica]|nr:hypothetical protein LTR41_010893 [Exophiala xenobiotica]KAK5216675.1 hypothetical protein LTR72_010343 [Exophiala xenobiotica]KAK5225142.1 hypothetical protein LTR47_009567 [Exophiala xenobiotica]KAK5246444.1 hypothetical protein LTS06_008245 [Exophiala xenobiotica]KAK5282815.1 hypothetical protein LTR40_002739 [Exophiala xenobiotica]